MVADKPMTFYIMQTKQNSLLSVDLCLSLGLLAINKKHVNLVRAPEPEIQELVDKYKDVFKGASCILSEHKFKIIKGEHQCKTTKGKYQLL